MLKQVSLAHFEPVVTRFGPWKMPKCLANGLFRDQKWVKNGSKAPLSKRHLGAFGMLKQVFLAQFEHVVTLVGPWKMPKCIKNGPVWDQKWVQNRSKMRFSIISRFGIKNGPTKKFSKSDPGPFGKCF